MDFPNKIEIPVNSNDPIFDMLGLYIDSFESGEIPESDKVDLFDTENGKTIFDILVDAGKYLGEDLLHLDTSETTNTTTTLQNEISIGPNVFNPFSNFDGDQSFSIPITDSSFIHSGATAGSSIEDSDVIWQFIDGNIEGAWLKSSKAEFKQDTACMKFANGVNEFRFPYIHRGIIGDGIEWTGKGINNCSEAQYLNEEQQKLAKQVDEIYWADTTSTSMVDPIALNQTNLVDSGAYASKNVFYADQIKIRPSKDSTAQDFAWLYDFDHTELPISCGSNLLYFPLFRLDNENAETAFNITPDQTEDIYLKELSLTKNLCGAIAGTTPDTSDKIYKKTGLCGGGIEGAWLRSTPIDSIGQTKYLPTTIEAICGAYSFSIEGSQLHISGEYETGGETETYDECCDYGTRVSPIQTKSFDYVLLNLDDDTYDYTVENIGTQLKIHGVKDESTTTIKYELTTNGKSTITLSDTNSSDVFEVNISNLILGVMEKVKSIHGAGRQSGVHLSAVAGEYSHFFWEFPDTEASMALNGFEHDEHCDFLKIDSYNSIINPLVGGETNQWEKCNCKAVYYSPIGNKLENFDDYKEYQDIIFMDVGDDPFSFETWRDENGNNYKNSKHFGVFKYKTELGVLDDQGNRSGGEPDVGYGIGVWETLIKIGVDEYGDDVFEPFVLKKGKSYVYKRADFGGCDDNRPPCFIANNCHCFDNCSDETGVLEWIGMSQDEDGNWISTNEISNMKLEAGQYYDYDKQKEIKYNIVKNDEVVERVTTVPSFSMNIKFKEAKPYWASSPNISGLNVGLDSFETDSYLLTTQPKPSEIILTDDLYVNYVRNNCDPFIWNQPLNFTIDTQEPDTWKKIDFGFTNPKLLQHIVGCGSCELVLGVGSCSVKDRNCDSYIASITPTDEDSDMIIRSSIDCGSLTEVYYSAQTNFIWEQEFETKIIKDSTTSVYAGSKTPWRNLRNENKSLISFDERGMELKTAKEIGVFKPENVGTFKIQQFGIENQLK